MSITSTTRADEAHASSDGQPGLKEQAKQQVQKTLQRSQEKAGDLMEQASAQVKARINDKKDDTAETLEAVATAIRGTGEQLQISDHSKLGNFAGDAARTVENVSNYLRRSDVDQFAQETERYARRQPIQFLGGALLLGFLAGRFFASSNKNASSGGGSADGMRALPENATPYSDAAGGYGTTFAEVEPQMSGDASLTDETPRTHATGTVD